MIRTTAVGALCLGGAVGSCVGFGHSGGAWVPYAIVAVGTLIMWMLGRTLRDRLVEGQRISEVSRNHNAQAQERTEVARAMAASLADRALAQSRQVRGDQETLRVAEISVANHTLAQRILDEAGTAIERLTEIEREFRRVVAAVARTERISAGSSGSFEDIANAATRANRLIINTAIGGAKADRATLDRELSAVAHAVQDVAQRSDLAAREQTVLHRTLAEAHGDADAMIAVRADLGRVLEALGTLREGLEVVEGGTAGVTTSVADTLAALCVDARFIDRELAALQGERELEDIASLALPPHPLDWDQLDEQVRMGVQAIDETGNMDPR